jgi:AraC-like DNA-binding protein
VPLLDPIIYAGLGNALLLALATGWNARRDRRWSWLCALFALMLLTLTAIVVTHRTEGEVERAAVAVEQIGWFVGPVLFHYVRASLGHVLTLRRAIPHFAIPAAIVLIGTPLILQGIEPPPAALHVLFHVCYTIASVVQFLRRPERNDRSLAGFWAPLAVLSAMVAIHAAQLLRFSPWGTALADAVPLIGAVFAFALVFGALLLTQAPRTGDGPRYAKSALDDQRARRIFEQARIAISGGLYRRFDLSLVDVAEEIGVPVHHLSQSISVAGNTSFNELVGRLRVEEAQRLLLDPSNAGVAVEPLGMEAGFRSRSAFYAAFRGQTGSSLADFRKKGGLLRPAR